MSVQKKKKLETAINNLFSSPRTRPVPTDVTEISKEPVENVSNIVEIESVPDGAIMDRSPVEMPASEPEPSGVIQSVPVVSIETATNLPFEMMAQPKLSSAVESVMVPVKPTGAGKVEAVGTASADPQPPEGQESVQMVVFTLDGQFYGIDITAVQSIIKMQSITRLPHVPRYTMGLTNLRGKVVPVFSLRRRFELPDCPEDKINRIIIIRREQEDVGLVVDGVSEVETILRENIEPAPPMTLTVSTQFITGIAKLDERLVILLNVDKVIASSD